MRLKAIRQQSQQLEDVRMDKVEALRAQFANRTYNVSSEDVADKIIADAETLVF